MSILITGGRGKIARAVHAGLTAIGLDVRLASREPSESSITLDLADPTSLATALKDVTQVFLYADPASAQSFVAAAESAGVKQVVLLSSMSTHAADAESAGDLHAVAERIIATGSFATTFLQPGTFMSNAIFWSHQIRALGQVRLPYLDAEEAPIHEQDIADVAIRVLSDGPGSEHDGRAYAMTGPESMTRRHQIAMIAETTGIPIESVDLTPDQARAEMGHAMRNPAQLEHLMSYWASRVGIPHPIEPTVEQLTDHPARPFTTWLQDYPNVFG